MLRRLGYYDAKIEKNLAGIVNETCQETKKISDKMSRCCNDSSMSQSSPGGIRTEAAMCAPEIITGGTGLALAAIKARKTQKEEENVCCIS